MNEQGSIVPALYLFLVVASKPDIVSKKTLASFKDQGFDVLNLKFMDLQSVPEEKRRVAKEDSTRGSSAINISVHMCRFSFTPNCGWSMRQFRILNFPVGFVNKFTDVSEFESPIKERVNSYLIQISNKTNLNMKI